jgi:cysteine sulfinate desulfinase/cysteine desulfurase-like protein
MTANTDSLLHDFGRSNDRHAEAARKKIAPEIQKPKSVGGILSPETAGTADAEKPKEVK